MVGSGGDLAAGERAVVSENSAGWTIVKVASQAGHLALRPTASAGNSRVLPHSGQG